MQTFLPYKSFETSARVLDRMRLGKQRVENMQIMRALLEGGAWENHPATLMWVGHADWLMNYQEAICNEWTNRGYNDTCLEKTREIFQDHMSYDDISGEDNPPWWLGLKKFHSSMRANLLRKDYIFYLKYKWPEKPAEGYWWPTKNMKGRK